MTDAPELEPAALEAAWLAHDNACPGEHWKKRERMAVAIRAYLAARSVKHSSYWKDRATAYEAEAADLRRKLEEAEQKAERQWEGWVREEAVRKAADRKLEEARKALEWQPVETAPKGTIVNVVGRYKHATAGFPRYAALNEEVNEWFEYSKHKPEPLVVWAWRPREEWPQEPAAPLPEDTHHG